MGLLQFIASRNYIIVNKDIIKTIGLEEAIILGELTSEYDYWDKQNKLEDGFFYSSVKNIEDNTTLSEHKQRKAINKLKQLGILEIQLRGLPAKRCFRLDKEKIKTINKKI